MGHKTHPIGFRLGVIKDWQSRWFAGNRKDYSANVIEDWRIRDVIKTRYAEAGISKIEIERSAQDVTVNVHTARPGIVIGRGGQRVASCACGESLHACGGDGGQVGDVAARGERIGGALHRRGTRPERQK